MTPTNLWNKFKELPWYFKIIAFLPLVILIIVLFMVGTGRSSTEDSVLNHSKGKTDKILDEYKVQIEDMKREREKIAYKREQIKKDLDYAQDDYADTIKRIDNAPANELDSIAAELRANSSSN